MKYVYMALLTHWDEHPVWYNEICLYGIMGIKKSVWTSGIHPCREMCWENQIPMEKCKIPEFVNIRILISFSLWLILAGKFFT